MSLFRYAENAVLNSFFGKTSDFGALASRPTLWLGTSTTEPTNTATNITEPSSGNGYARVETSAGSWTSSTTGQIENAVDILFNESTGNQGTQSWLVVFDSSTNGNAVFFGQITTPKAIGAGDQAKFSAGNITITLD